MPPLDEKAFRSGSESSAEPSEVSITMGPPAGATPRRCRSRQDRCAEEGRLRPHWNGRSFSIELLDESDIEAFSIEMPDWVAFANIEFARREHTPAREALAEAQKRANALESRLQR